MKKRLAILALALSMTALVGCGESQKPNDKPTSAPTTQAPVQTTAPTVAPTEEPVVPTTKDYIDELSTAIEKTADEKDIFLELNIRTTGLNSHFAFVRSNGGTDGEIYGISCWNCGIAELEGKEFYYTNGYVFSYQDEELESKEEIETETDIFDEIGEIDVSEYEEHLDVKKETKGNTATYTVTITGLDEIDLDEIELPDLGDEIDLGDISDILGGDVEDIELPESISFTVTTEKGLLSNLSIKQSISLGESSLTLELSVKIVYGEDASYDFYKAVLEEAKKPKNN